MSQPFMEALRRKSDETPCRWTVTMRNKTGRAFPVMVDSASAEYAAISDAMNKAERFLPGLGWEAIKANRVL